MPDRLQDGKCWPTTIALSTKDSGASCANAARTVDFGTQSLPFTDLVAASGSQLRYIWLFYWVDGTFTADPIVAKLLETKAKLLFGDQRAAIVAVSMPEGDGRANVDLVLRSFLEALSPIEALLEQPARATLAPIKQEPR